MTATIITIGDEILIGQIVDTNSAWIAARLNDAGIEVRSKLSVGDEGHHIRQAIHEGLSACDVVITTGGIGPTRDDITKSVVAEYFDSPLVMHQPTYRHVEAMMAARGVDFNELNRSQALVPECATVLENLNGTAPGLWIERHGKTLVVLPGVPFEMEALMTDKVLPRLRLRGDGTSIVHRTMITSGIAESVLAEKISVWEDALPAGIKLAYLPSPAGVKLRLSAYGVDPTATGATIDALFASLEQIIPGNVIGYGEESLENRLARLLTDSGATLSVAESCTGGRIANRLTLVEGASGWFKCGVVAYSNPSKSDILGVDAADIARFGAVSAPVAEQMAEGIRRISGSDYALSTTGIAGPSGGSPDKPVGTIWIALATPAGVTSTCLHLGRLRAQNIERASTAALNMLRAELGG